MKKLFVFLLVAVFSLSFISCEADNSQETENTYAIDKDKVQSPGNKQGIDKDKVQPPGGGGNE